MKAPYFLEKKNKKMIARACITHPMYIGNGQRKSETPYPTVTIIYMYYFRLEQILVSMCQMVSEEKMYTVYCQN